MRKIKISFLTICMLAVAVSCDTAGGIDDEVFAIAGNGPIASWVSSAEGSDDLILSDPTSSAGFEVEFIDTSDGSSVEAFEMTVSDGTNTGVLISETSFSANEDGIQGFSGSFSLNDIASALGTSVADFDEGDEFSFTHTVTAGGEVYPSGNSNTFSNSIRDFDLEIPTETVSLTFTSSDSVYLNSNSMETLTMAFANDFTTELAVLPTVERVSAKGFSDDMVGEVTPVQDVDGVDSVYTFTYSPGEAVEDTISFIISGASALASGFEMETETFGSVFIIDNVTPTEVADVSSLIVEASGDTTGYRFNILFSEDIGKITMTANIIGVDDDGDDEIDEDGEFTELEATYSGSNLDYVYPWTGSEVGEVEITLEMRDRAGNILDYGTYITLTPAD